MLRYEMRFISGRKVIKKAKVTHYLSLLLFGKLQVHVTLHKLEYTCRSVGSNFLQFVSASCVQVNPN